MTDDKKENKKKWLLLLLLLLITIAAVGLSVWAIWFRDGDAILAPDYAPQQVEETPNQSVTMGRKNSHSQRAAEQ